jgi:hypothetical protein
VKVGDIPFGGDELLERSEECLVGLVTHGWRNQEGSLSTIWCDEGVPGGRSCMSACIMVYEPEYVQSCTDMSAEPVVEQSGSSNPMIYSGAVDRDLKVETRDASFSVDPRDPSPQSIDTPTIPDGGEGVGVQSTYEYDRRWYSTYRNTIRACRRKRRYRYIGSYQPCCRWESERPCH